jgi:hypothetical protein
MIISFPPVAWVGACAITVWPLILVDPMVKASLDRGGILGQSTLLHERVHLAQQRRWLIWGLGVGLLAWFAAYLLLLPCGANPFRARWERAAFAAQGLSEAEITEILKKRPYYLWWRQ